MGPQLHLPRRIYYGTEVEEGAAALWVILYGPHFNASLVSDKPCFRHLQTFFFLFQPNFPVTYKPMIKFHGLIVSFPACILLCFLCDVLQFHLGSLLKAWTSYNLGWNLTNLKSLLIFEISAELWF